MTTLACKRLDRSELNLEWVELIADEERAIHRGQREHLYIPLLRPTIASHHIQIYA